ncbi:MAG TPA: hypothetical protein V6D00_15660 [Pantanalinema sp.]
MLILQLLRLQPPQVSGEWHPSLIKGAAIAARIRASNGAIPGAITTGTIMDQLGGAQPIYAPTRVLVRLRNPNGTPHVLPQQDGRSVRPIDRDGDGMADGTVFDSSMSSGYFQGIRLSDPISASNYTIYPGGSEIELGNIPPGSYRLSYGTEWDRYSNRPWIVYPVNRVATVSVLPNSNPVIDIHLIDVSKPVSVEATGSFSSAGVYDAMSYDWHRFATAPNLVYRISYDASQYGSGGAQKLMIFDMSGTQLFQSDAATDSYTFASAASNSLYVYTPYGNTLVDVTTETLGANQSLYNATIQYGQ